MNGKGDKSRVRDIERYRKNFDAIQWAKPRRPVGWIDLINWKKFPIELPQPPKTK